ncbi:hypothetical protein HFP51_12900 [Parasphingopyxis sp. CP4]|uniref:hypothetical protein n=1 Tax=Parasphingopyxis sp. CP4 TaxID=2724527 RepID=UPI0015A36FA8|nr:hypothetical protein [Parasphingopyxis sp. CP4]QLC23005.1 hypothetical protein HFP51_12900 [Parasphingopyxis sp. CP4]
MSFGIWYKFMDRAKIKKSEETDRRGLAGLEGHIYGWTTPSVTGVDVIGAQDEDFAINVFIETLDEDFWFTKDLVEVLGPEVGAVFSLDASENENVRLPDGSWKQRPKRQ